MKSRNVPKAALMLLTWMEEVFQLSVNYNINCCFLVVIKRTKGCSFGTAHIVQSWELENNLKKWQSGHFVQKKPEEVELT